MNKLKNSFTFTKISIKKFRKTRTRNKVLIVAGLIMFAFVSIRQIKNANAQPLYTTVPVERGSIVQIVSETGNVDTAGRADVYSAATGVIEELYVKNNDHVVVNQNLFKVRSTATDQEKATAYANYMNAMSAQKTAEQNKQNLDAAMWAKHQALLDARNTKNYKDDNKQNPATKEDYTDLEKQSIDTALIQAEKNFAASEQQYKEADLAVTAAAAQVSAAWFAYQATQDIIVKAPTAGTVANLSFTLGDTVSAAGMLSGGASTAQQGVAESRPVLTIANLSNYSVKVALNEFDVPKVREGQTAVVTLDAFPGERFQGRVTHVDALGTNNSGVITYVVMVQILDPEESIRPEMTANVDIEVDNKEGVLTVPNNAIKPYQGSKAVQVIDPHGKKPKYIPVSVGIKSPEYTEITNGVSEGMQVITGIKNNAPTVSSGGPFGR